MISDFPRYGNDLTSSNNANLNGNDVLTNKRKNYVSSSMGYNKWLPRQFKTNFHTSHQLFCGYS